MSEPGLEDDRFAKLAHRLGRIERLLAIGFSQPIQSLRDAHDVGDEVTAEILSRTPDWTSAGELKAAVVKATKQSEPTVKRRLKKLVELGALETEGAGPSVRYRSTGRFG